MIIQTETPIPVPRGRRKKKKNEKRNRKRFLDSFHHPQKLGQILGRRSAITKINGIQPSLPPLAMVAKNGKTDSRFGFDKKRKKKREKKGRAVSVAVNAVA